MRTLVCNELLHHIGDILEVEICPSPMEVIEWTKAVELPFGLAQLLRFDWPQESFDLYKYRFYSSLAISEDAYTPVMLHQGFLNIGHAPNGDWLVLKLMGEECEVGMLNHEIFDEGEADLTTLYEPIARSFESFLNTVVNGRYLPTDYFAAKDFNGFLEDERKATQS